MPAVAMPPKPAARPSPPRKLEGEQLLTIEGIEWDRYLRIDQVLEKQREVRLTYCDGNLQIMTISYNRERIKKTIASLLEFWWAAIGQYFRSEGSMTRRIDGSRGVEADDSWTLELGAEGPHLVIEVAITSGGIDKLEVYRPFEIPEVWIWSEGRIQVFEFVSGAYQKSQQSARFPDLDLKLVEELATWQDTSDAIIEFRGRQLGF